MPKKLQKYFSKFTKPPSPPNQESYSYQTCTILPRCRVPRTASYSHDRAHDAGHDAVVNRFLLNQFDKILGQPKEIQENYGSAKPGSETFHESTKTKGDRRASKGSVAAPDFKEFRISKALDANIEPKPRVFFEPSRQSIDWQRDIDVSHSDRFFVTASRSSSLMEEAWLSSTDDSESTVAGEAEMAIPDDSVAVKTRTADPYEDFRRSMEEMVDARSEQGGELDWDFMEGLLFCYLNLNEEESHRYIVAAFADMVARKILRQKKDMNRERSFCRKDRNGGAELVKSRFNGPL